MALIECPECNKEISDMSTICVHCGFPIKEYLDYCYEVENQESLYEYNGVYRYTIFGGKQEVYCPRCGSDDCSHYQEQKMIPGKKKTRYTANLNPFHPFTFVNKKEKVIREEKIVTDSKFVCNNCGKIFK